MFRYCSNSRQQQRRKCCRNFNIGILQQKVSGTWSRDEVYTYTRDNGTAYAGYLFTGTFDKNTDTYTLGIQHESRPTSISFDYKYSPVINDKCLAYAKVYNADKKKLQVPLNSTHPNKRSIPRRLSNLNITKSICKARPNILLSFSIRLRYHYLQYA